MKIIIPMAGLGSRFTDAGYTTHKPLIKVNGKTLIQYAIESLDLPDWDVVLVCRDLGGTYLDDLRTSLESIPNSISIKVIEKLTTGAAETALAGVPDDYNRELIITNCDQYLEWDSKEFIRACRTACLGGSGNSRGAVLTYKSTDPKNSFAVTNKSDKIIRLVEKKAESDKALVGVHYWANAQDFVSSAKRSLADFENGETYVSETYNYLIEYDGAYIRNIDIGTGTYWSTGTPDDLAYFKGFIAEYKTPKNKTWFIDLDGTVFMHAHKYSNLKTAGGLCPGVREALDELDSKGDTIILATARKESARAFTEALLEEYMIPYNQLIMGVSQGERVVVNDIISPNSTPRARGVNVITDKGWNVDEIC